MKKITTTLILMFLSLALIFACLPSEHISVSAETGEEEVKEEDKYGGVLNVAIAAIANNIDPIKYTGIYESQVIAAICDTLVYYNSEMTEIVPGLATSWEVNDTGDVYTFKLRDDVYFQPGKYQDGRQMTSEDVKYSLERSKNESALNRIEMLDHCEVKDDYTVECYLDSPNSSFMAALTNNGNAIICKEEAEGWGDEFGAHLVGTGPFKIKDWTTDVSCEVERFDNYWGAKPYLDGVVFHFVPDNNARINSLRAGEVDIALDLRDEAIQLARQESGLHTNEVPGMKVSYIYMNMVEGPTADKKVREAIIRAVDIDAMCEALYQFEEAQRAYMPLPPSSWGYDEDLESHIPEYDPELARELLAEAGYPDGFSIEYYTSDTESSLKAATVFQQFMKLNLNVDVKIKTAQWGAFSSTAASGNAPIYAMSWTWYPDPYFYLNNMFHSDSIGSLGNGQGFNDEKVDQLLDEAVLLTEQDERAELYKEALAIIVDSYAQIDYSNSMVIDGLSDKVQDFESMSDVRLILCSEATGHNVWLAK